MSADSSSNCDRLMDRWEITEMLNSYAFHFDRNEPAEVGELFHTDCVVDYGPEIGPIVGREALVDSITVGLDEIFTATSHHISNVSVRFEDASSALAIAYVYAWHRYRDGSPDGYIWGQYHTRFRRGDDGWKLTHMTLKIAGAIDFHRSAMHPIERQPGSTPPSH